MSDVSKRLKLALCPHASWTGLTSPISGSAYCCQQKRKKKVCFWPFVCRRRCVLPVSVFSLACQWMKCPAEYWELLSKQCRGMEKGAPFFICLSTPGLRCMCLSVLLQSLAEAPAFSLTPTARHSSFTPASLKLVSHPLPRYSPTWNRRSQNVYD